MDARPPDPEVIAAQAEAMNALTNGDQPEPSIPDPAIAAVAAEAAQRPPKGPQPMGGGFTLEEALDAVQRLRTDVGGLISRTDQLETTVRRTDRQMLMLIGIVSVIMWGVKGLAVKLEEAIGDAAVS